jgi:hypothetical protein
MKRSSHWSFSQCDGYSTISKEIGIRNPVTKQKRMRNSVVEQFSYRSSSNRPTHGQTRSAPRLLTAVDTVGAT